LKCHKGVACLNRQECGILQTMSTLSEIEVAAERLVPEQKQELMLFLAARLRVQGAKLPEPIKFSPAEISGWIAEDEADMQRFLKGA
jgi:hypothetical protein